MSSEGPAMSWRLVQVVPCPRPETRLGLAPAATPCSPMERDKWLRTMTWHDITGGNVCPSSWQNRCFAVRFHNGSVLKPTLDADSHPRHHTWATGLVDRTLPLPASQIKAGFNAYIYINVSMHMQRIWEEIAISVTQTEFILMYKYIISALCDCVTQNVVGDSGAKQIGAVRQWTRIQWKFGVKFGNESSSLRH